MRNYNQSRKFETNKNRASSVAEGVASKTIESLARPESGVRQVEFADGDNFNFTDSSLAVSGMSRTETLMCILRELRRQNELIEKMVTDDIVDMEEFDRDMRLRGSPSFVLGSFVGKHS